MSVVDAPEPTISVNEFAEQLRARRSLDERDGAIDLTARLAELAGLAVACVDLKTNSIVANKPVAAWLSPGQFGVVKRLSFKLGVPEQFEGGVALSWGSRRYVSVAVAPELDSGVPREIVELGRQSGWSERDLADYWMPNYARSTDDISRLLSLAWRVIQSEQELDEREHTIQQLSESVDATVDEISLLHFLAQNLQVSKATFELATSCLPRLRESLRCDGAAIWLAGESGRSEYHRDGAVPLDELELALALSNFDDHDWPTPLILNHSVELGAGIEAGLTSLAVAPLMNGEERGGWLVAVNSLDGEGFGQVEAGMLQSIATSLGTHLQNAAAMAKQEELLLSFVRSMVSSLDAKDRYTRGHSERVAMIARRLAIELRLTDQEVEDIYLAGLLHDVGKIGVDDAILRKPGRLTDEEFDEIKKHPSIGYQILSGIDRLKHILPGVRNHHESFDGSGYPDGLAGYDISLMARVLAVADSYDAMGSDRPYRNGMPLEKLESILREGRGSQWDAEIIDAYFSCRDDIRELCIDWTARQVG